MTRLLARKIVVPSRIDWYEDDLAVARVVNLVGDFHFVAVHKLLHDPTEELWHGSGVLVDLVEECSEELGAFVGCRWRLA